MSRLNIVISIVLNKQSNCGSLIGRIVPTHNIITDAVCIHRYCSNCGVHRESLKKLDKIGVKNV